MVEARASMITPARYSSPARSPAHRRGQPRHLAIAEIKSKMATKDDIADVKSTLADHTKILNNHTPDLAVIKNDVTTNLDKRLQLAVRVSAIEKHLAVRQVRHQPRQKRPYTRRPYLATRSQTNGCGAWSRATNCPTPENVGG
jgi:hypothetical protein